MKSRCATVPVRSHILDSWSHRLAWPRTEPSQGLNTGSNPVGTTKLFLHLSGSSQPFAVESSPRSIVHRTIHRTKGRCEGESQLHGAADSIRTRHGNTDSSSPLLQVIHCRRRGF